jgi:hypothetical protein
MIPGLLPVAAPTHLHAEHDKPPSSLKNMTRSTSPAISYDQVRDRGEEMVILMEAYAVRANLCLRVPALQFVAFVIVLI